MMKACIQIFLFTLSFTGSIHLNFEEGEQAEIIFQYNGLCENNTFALSIGNRLPYYQAGKISPLGLYSNQYKRYGVQLKEFNENENNFCYISVDIKSVHREDAGTYICHSRIMDDDESNDYFSRVRVNVIFPPGKASCNIDTPPEDTANGWLVLRCTAEAGYYLGKFECYQNGILVPPWKKPTQRGSILKQSLWIQKAFPVFCCSTSYNKHKNLCECRDFMWDPITGNGTNDNVVPCKVTTISASENENTLQASPIPATKENRLTRSDVTSEKNIKTNISTIEIDSSKYIWQYLIVLLVLAIFIFFTIIIWRYVFPKGNNIKLDKIHDKPIGKNKQVLETEIETEAKTEAETEVIDIVHKEPKQVSLDYATENHSMNKKVQDLEKQKKRYMRKRNQKEDSDIPEKINML